MCSRLWLLLFIKDVQANLSFAKKLLQATDQDLKSDDRVFAVSYVEDHFSCPYLYGCNNWTLWEHVDNLSFLIPAYAELVLTSVLLT